MKNEDSQSAKPKKFDPKIVFRAKEQKGEVPKKTEDKPKSILEEMGIIREQLKALADTSSKKETKKAFKFPLNVKRQTKNLKRLMLKNKVQVILLKLTGAAQPTIGEINAGRLFVGDYYWNAADDIIWNWNGTTPTAFVTEWDMQPLTKQKLMQQTDELKTWLHPQTILMRMIEAKEATDKVSGQKFKPAALIAIAVVGIIAYYLFVGGG